MGAPLHCLSPSKKASERRPKPGLGERLILPLTRPMPAAVHARPAASVCATGGPHALSGVPLKLSISLTDLKHLDEPPVAVSGKARMAGSASAADKTSEATSSTPDAVSPPATVEEWTPDEPRAFLAPWARPSPSESPASQPVLAQPVNVPAVPVWPKAPVAAQPGAAEEDAADDDAGDDALNPDGAPKSAVKKCAWSAEEDAKLLELVERLGPSNWSRIAADLPSRIGKQCRERWHNHLSPAVKKEVRAPPLIFFFGRVNRVTFSSPAPLPSLFSPLLPSPPLSNAPLLTPNPSPPYLCRASPPRRTTRS